MRKQIIFLELLMAFILLSMLLQEEINNQAPSTIEERRLTKDLLRNNLIHDSHPHGTNKECHHQSKDLITREEIIMKKSLTDKFHYK